MSRAGPPVADRRKAYREVEALWAHLFHVRHDPSESAEILKEIAAIRLGEKPFTTAQAAVLQELAAYRQALAILDRVLGPGHLDSATILHNLGGLAHARGDFAAGGRPTRCGRPPRAPTIRA